MAIDNSTPTFGDESPSDPELEKYTPAARRVFARRFPGITLNAFRRLDATLKTMHVLSYQGPESELLAFGLVDADEVPKKPKRQKHGNSDTTDSWISIDRMKGGALKVVRHLEGSLHDEHALSEFDVHNWPLIELSAETRREALAELRRGLCVALGRFSERCVIELGNVMHGHKPCASEILHLQSDIQRFEREFMAAVASLRLEAPRATATLQLVVDNTSAAGRLSADINHAARQLGLIR
jgi:hypothetical protein